MKQAAQKLPTTAQEINSKEIQELTRKIEQSEKAMEKAFAEYEKKQQAYKSALQDDLAINVFIQMRADMKIAKLTYKIKRISFKAAKSEHKYALKLAKKAGQKGEKENKASDTNASKTSKQDRKKSKGVKKVTILKTQAVKA